MTNLLIVVLFSLAYALFDYFGYNWSIKRIPIVVYHIFADLLLAGLLYLLWKGLNLEIALGVFIFYWCFGDDYLYYVWAEFLNIPGFEGRGSLEKALNSTQITWAWWTPLGIYRMLTGHPKSEPIPNKWLLIQAGIGLTLTILITSL